MKVGFDLWAKVQPWDRDYFLPRPMSDYRDFHPKVATPADAGHVGRQLLAELKVPYLDMEASPPCWRSTEDPLVEGHLVDGWTGHSERATLPSALAALGVPKEKRNFLGRWSPDGSDDYVRTYRAVVRELIGTFAKEIKKGAGFK
eukprot:5693350-Lingulodinium_polyedra.AAC.1